MHYRLGPVALAFGAALAVAACTSASDEPLTPSKGASAGQAAVRADRTVLVLGVLPATKRSSVAADYQILVQELSVVLARQVELSVPATYADMVAGLRQGKIHLGQLSAYAYVKARQDLGGEILVQQRMATDSGYRGVFVVKDSSALENIDQLQGKRFAFVDRASSAGFYYPRMHLRHAGVDPAKFFSAVVFAGTHDKVIALVQEGAVDAGAISTQSLSEGLHLKKIGETAVIPDDAIVAGKGLSAQERKLTRDYLLRAHSNSRLNIFMNRRGIERYVAADDGVYADLAAELAVAPGK